MKNTDVHRVDQKSKPVYIVSGHHSVKTEKDGVRIFRDTNGKLEGHISSLSNRGKLISSSMDEPVLKNVELCASSVGRIFVSYRKNDDTEDIWYTGTGFRVSEDKIITAYHVIKPIHKEKETTYFLHKIYIYFEVDATLFREIILEELKTMENVFELECPKDERSVNAYFPVQMESKKGNMDFKWETINDISVLTLLKKPPDSVKFVFPYIPPSSIFNCFVIGYPSAIEYDKFKLDYDTNTEDLYSLYLGVVESMTGFQRKIVSTAEAVKNNIQFGIDNCNVNTLSTHRCPTIRGTSGGLFGVSDYNKLHFSGIHIGGDKSMDNNFFIPVDNPVFVYMYMKHVATKQFISQHQNQLDSYLKHFKNLTKIYSFMNNLQIS